MKFRIARGCTFCGTCVYECPAGAVTMTGAGARIDTAVCTGCGACYRNCASEAIEPIDEETTEEGKDNA